MFEIKARYYSECGRLVWIRSESFYGDTTDLTVILAANNLFRWTGGNLGAIEYEGQQNTYASVYGPTSTARCVPLNPCNIQIRKDGKLIPWRNI